MVSKAFEGPLFDTDVFIITFCKNIFLRYQHLFAHILPKRSLEFELNIMCFLSSIQTTSIPSLLKLFSVEHIFLKPLEKKYLNHYHNTFFYIIFYFIIFLFFLLINCYYQFLFLCMSIIKVIQYFFIFFFGFYFRIQFLYLLNN